MRCLKAGVRSIAVTYPSCVNFPYSRFLSRHASIRNKMDFTGTVGADPVRITTPAAANQCRDGYMAIELFRQPAYC